MRVPLLLLVVASAVRGDPGTGGLYPPGLQPLIARANGLLATGQFAAAVGLYSDAIEQSPADYLLYYKRATASYSLSRHVPALEDFDKVLALTAGTFDNAHLMKARIHARDGSFDLARDALALYRAASPDAHDLLAEITEAQRMRAKMDNERSAQLWNACVESASGALRTASHAIDIRSVRAECALAAGDIESAVGDLTRLSSLLPPSTTLLTTIFRLSYFLLPPSPAPLNTLKQCLHYDPDSRPCLALHRLLKSFDRAFSHLDTLTAREDWRGVVRLLVSKSPVDAGGRASGKEQGDLMRRFDDAMRAHMSRDQILPRAPASPSSTSSSHTHKHQKHQAADADSDSDTIPLPNPATRSPQRQTLVRALCVAYTHLHSASSAGTNTREMERWCAELRGMDGCAEDVDGLVGLGEALLTGDAGDGESRWEEAVRALERAWNASGGSRRDIHQRLQRAQKLLKQSRQKDYYKILGVGRDADERTVKKAFRVAAKKAHPDKGGSEAKMAALNEAYEVLSNPELRQRFDNGEDPNDPMAQQGGHPFANGQHPFAQFFQQGTQGGAGGFQFHFSHGH